MGLQQTLAHLFHPRRSNNHRPWLLHPEALLVLTLMVTCVAAIIYGWVNLPGEQGFVLGYASSITPTQVVELTNAERAKSGLPPLSYNAELSVAASTKGKHMFANQYWAHTAPDGTQPWSFIRTAGYSYTVAGENLARDFSDTNTMVSAWMASPTHKANIVNPRYRDLGIAVVDGTLDGVETTLVVQMFGTPKAAAVVAAIPDAPAVTISEEAPLPSPVLPPTASSAAILMADVELKPGTEASLEAALETTQSALSANTQPPTRRDAVLASFLVPQGEVLVPPLFTPLQLMKAVFLSITMILILTLMYDGFVIGHRYTLRLVGNNLAHIAFWFAVTFLIIFFKGGIIG